MSLPWVAGDVRARLLASRRIGAGPARAIADCGSLEQALQALAKSPYGAHSPYLLTLREAQRSVAESVLWHLRVLAGWLPPSARDLLRTLAAWFEIVNIEEREAYLLGAPFQAPFQLGSLTTAWKTIAAEASPTGLRDALGRSPWGDPGSDSPAQIGVQLRLRWAGRVRSTVPEALEWTDGALALYVARLGARGGVALSGRSSPVPWLREGLAAPGLAELRALLPPTAAWALDAVDSVADLWQAEVRWWERIERDALALLRGRHQRQASAVGMAALMATDARRACAALEAAARGRVGREMFDAVA